MSSSHQLREGAVSDYGRPIAPAEGSWERPDWQREQQAIETQRRARDEPPGTGSSVVADTGRRSAMGSWMKALGSLGFMLGGASAGYFAHQMGYDWRATWTIAGLVGIAAGSVGVMIPPLFRALGWTIVAALAGGAGAAALYALMRVAPAFVDRIIEVLREVIG